MEALKHECGVAMSVLLKGQCLSVMQNALCGKNAETDLSMQYAGGCKGVGRYIDSEAAVPCVKRFSLVVGCCKEMCCISALPRSFDFQYFFSLAAVISCMLFVFGQYTYIADHLRF